MTCVLIHSQVGDGTNFVLVLCGALLQHAEELLRMGLSSAEIIEGFEIALKKSLEILPSKFVGVCNQENTRSSVCKVENRYFQQSGVCISFKFYQGKRKIPHRE